MLPSCKSTRAAVLLYPFQRLFLSAQLQLLLLVVVVVRPTTPMQDQGPYYYYYLCCQRSEEGQLNDSPLWSPASTPLGCAAAGHETGPLTQHARPKPCSPVPGQSDSYHPFYYPASGLRPSSPGLNNAKTNALRQHCEQYSLHCQFVNNIEWSPAITPQTVFQY